MATVMSYPASPAELPDSAQALVQEFLQLPGLTEVDAYKSAFTVFALGHGWSKAKIGRYLGISRARVGQKVTKCQQYAEQGNMPTLTAVMNRTAALDRDDSGAVHFDRGQWDDPEFARGMLALVA